MSPFALEGIAKAYWQGEGKSFVGGVGKGAFKETFHIRNKDGQSEALKIYNPGSSAQRSEREISAIQRCDHPNIVRLTSVELFEWKGSKYLVTREEFISGGTLTSRVLGSGLLTPDQAQDLASALIGAVSHIASLHLVHRDLKPDNIMLRDGGLSPTIVDFGLVRDLRETSLTHTFALQGPGTPLFAPAEQLINEKQLIDWRSDQFSLAVLLSYVTFGFHPYSFEKDTNAEIIQRVATRGPLADRFVQQATNSRLASLIKMASPWPVQRYRTPRMLEQAWQEQRKAI